MGEVTVATFKVVRETGLRLLKNEAQKVTVLQGWQQVLDYF
jgi:DNA repair protein RadC